MLEEDITSPIVFTLKTMTLRGPRVHMGHIGTIYWERLCEPNMVPTCVFNLNVQWFFDLDIFLITQDYKKKKVELSRLD